MGGIRTTLLIVLSALSMASSPAIAGDWSNGCGVCQADYSVPGPTYYIQPTYAYAAPTVPVVPHVVVQPNYIVQRTYVVHQEYYVADTPACSFGCEPHRIVDQGQYSYRSAWTPAHYLSRPAIYEGYHGDQRGRWSENKYVNYRRSVTRHASRTYWIHSTARHRCQSYNTILMPGD